MQALDLSFTPGPFDVIIGRGKKPRLHPGNAKFHSIIRQEFLPLYSEAETRTLKTQIVAEIVSLVRRNSPGGGFVKCMNGRWYEVGEHMAREKVSQSLRDELYYKYESAAKTKRKKRAKIRGEHGPEDPLPSQEKNRCVGGDGVRHDPSFSSLPPKQQEIVRAFSTVSPEVSRTPLRRAPLLSGMGRPEKTSMASCVKDLRLRRQKLWAAAGVPIGQTALPPPPSLYRPMIDGFRSLSGDSSSPDNSRGLLQHVPSSREGETVIHLPLENRLQSNRKEEEIDPEHFMAACNQLSDWALLNGDPKLINAYCTVMASIKGGKGDPDDVILTGIMLRKALFPEW